ncbi:MAG: DUF2061 domain-containing protein [Paracoccaceae bacterium]
MSEPIAKPAPVEPREIQVVEPNITHAKAISWRIVGTLDTLLLSFVILTFLAPVFGMEPGSHADNAQTATFIAVTEVVTKMVLYYAHERLWERSRWDVGVDDRGARRDGPKRSGVKTATWRITASLDTMILALVFTGNLGTAVSIGGFEVITKLFLYYFHERAWSRVRWGMKG